LQSSPQLSSCPSSVATGCDFSACRDSVDSDSDDTASVTDSDYSRCRDSD
jgi:hypothetical protein